VAVKSTLHSHVSVTTLPARLNSGAAHRPHSRVGRGQLRRTECTLLAYKKKEKFSHAIAADWQLFFLFVQPESCGGAERVALCCCTGPALGHSATVRFEIYICSHKSICTVCKKSRSVPVKVKKIDLPLIFACQPLLTNLTIYTITIYTVIYDLSLWSKLHKTTIFGVYFTGQYHFLNFLLKSTSFRA
jgi:hypothetical protein